MCLHNEPSQQIDVTSFCGDYIVNGEGEECDCGGVDTCDDPCCHPNNCTLVTGTQHNWGILKKLNGTKAVCKKMPYSS